MTDKALRYNEGKPRFDLIPFDALEELAKIYTFGATKYSRTTLERFMQCVNADEIVLFIPSVCVVRVTKKIYGKETQSTQKDNDRTVPNGLKEIKIDSKNTEELDTLIPTNEGKCVLQKEDLIYKTSVSPLKIVTKDWHKVVKFAEQQNTCTLITITKQEGSEEYFAVSTTTVLGSLVTTLKDLKPHLSISEMLPTSGVHNWAKGMSWSSTQASLMRHLSKWAQGEDEDEESGLHHMAHVAWNAMTLVAFAKREIGTDDRFKTTEKEEEPSSPSDSNLTIGYLSGPVSLDDNWYIKDTEMK